MSRLFACPQLKEFLQFVLTFVCVAAFPPKLHAQTTTAPPRWRVFLECPRCDDAFTRPRLDFVELVRDPLIADTHVIVAGVESGSGGEVYMIEAVSRRPIRRDTLLVTIPPAATESELRESLLRGIRLALVPALLHHPVASLLELNTLTTHQVIAPAPAQDPWHRWVFRVNLSGDAQSDENYGQVGFQSGVSVSRISDAHKFTFNATESNRKSRVRLSDSTILRAKQRDRNVRFLSVWSVSPRLSAGAQGSIASSIFQNTRFRTQLDAAFEANLFPYSEATRRQALVRYTAGYDARRYVDTTIFGLLRETRPVHSVVLRGDSRETWGGAWVRGTWSQYLHDGRRRRVTLDFNVDWRVAAGVSVYVGGSYASINDQLSLAGANLSDEDRLLRLRELRSGFSTYTAAGVSFTFGSVFNNIVNQRFPN